MTRKTLRSLPIIAAALAAFAFALAMAAWRSSPHGPAGTRPLAGPWEYRWAASAAQARDQGDGWLPLDNFPASPPGRDGRDFLALKTTLPETGHPNPFLLLQRIYLLAEVYVGGELVYTSGNLDADETELFAGLQAHFVRIPPDSAGKELRFAFRSDYAVIGLKQDVWMGDRGDLIVKVLRDDIDRIALTTLFLVAAIASILLRWRHVKVAAFGSFSLIALGAAFHTLYYSTIKQFLFDDPIAWNYIWLVSTATMITSTLFFMYRIMGSRKRRIVGAMILVHAAHTLALIIAFALERYSIASALATARLFIYIAELAVAVVLILPGFAQRRRETRILAGGLGGFVLVMAWDVLAASQATSRYVFGTHWGFLILLGAMGWILGERVLEAFRIASNHAAEMELARYDERERIYADLHDHLGSSLNELSQLSRQGVEGGMDGAEALKELDVGLRGAYTALRDRLDNLEEEALMRSDFVGALHSTLVRRYSRAGRRLAFDAPAAAREAFQARLAQASRADLMAALLETATNDLKYGRGPSAWTLAAADGGGLSIAFSAATNYTQTKASPGRGTGTIAARMKKIGAIYLDGPEILNGTFRFSIRLP